mmetsp:Transcript_7749/g.21758  ORF Transcript_7749/g.21758 Transcript_7749/m.21758 type:complete len:321 (-) Transcript_7749:179-1141(-)
MWLIFDCFGITLGVLTWVFVAFADWVVVQYVLTPSFGTSQPRIAWLPYTDGGALIFLVYQGLILLSWSSHVAAMLTNPGTIRPKTAPAAFEGAKVCKICHDRWKPPRAHHCKTCKVCIFQMDHHCPWINNCVGLENQKLFILFLVYTATASAVTLLLLASSAASWVWARRSSARVPPPTTAALVCCALVALECVAAILFVSGFLWEQMDSIRYNSTLVETYKRVHGKRLTFMENFRSVFGRRWWAWPWPFPSSHPADYTEPTFPDDSDTFNIMPDDADHLGIAGREDEDEAASKPGSAQGLQQIRHRSTEGAQRDVLLYQ